MDYAGIEYEIVQELVDFLNGKQKSGEGPFSELYIDKLVNIDAARAAAAVLINYDRGYQEVTTE